MASFEQLLAPSLQTARELPIVDTGDRAQLITKVYADMGIFDPEQAEAAPELLRPELNALAKQHPDTESFVAINLTEEFGLRALMTAFDREQSSVTPATWYRDNIWDQYDLTNLNRRSVDGDNEPVPNTVRGQVLTVDNNYNETGLVATNKNLAEQREAVASDTLLNATDYILLQAMRRENGEPLMDRQTWTRFVQMDQKTFGDVSSVGGALVYDTRLYLKDSGGIMFDNSGGVRRSVGLGSA